MPGDLKAKAAANVALMEERAAEPLLDFNEFVLADSSADMEARMLADRYVLGRLAILGQATVFYGGPNVGKTLLILWLLIQQIEAGEIDPADVYYINADDTFKGLVEKKKLAEQYGFNMLVPGMFGFKAPMLPVILRNRARQGTANACIVILDTLKKFTDLMSKKVGSEFGEVSREFIANGGTLISLAHVNKYKNDDGESIHAGTTDIIDDADCAYIMDLVEDNGTLRTVKFRNVKDRGDVMQSATYGYQSKHDDHPLPYIDLFDSVREITAREAREAEKRAAIADKLAINHELILDIQACIRDGFTLRTQLVKEAQNRSGESARKIKNVLKTHTGTNLLDGARWNCTVGDKNAHQYSLLIGGGGGKLKN